MKHEAVALVGVIGVPDPVRGEIVKAFIQRMTDYPVGNGLDALKEDITAFAKERCAPYEVPKLIEFVDDKAMQKRVSGCGRTLTYMYKCNGTAAGQDCRWKPVRDDSNKLN